MDIFGRFLYGAASTFFGILILFSLEYFLGDLITANLLKMVSTVCFILGFLVGRPFFEMIANLFNNKIDPWT